MAHMCAHLACYSLIDQARACQSMNLNMIIKGIVVFVYQVLMNSGPIC